MLDPVPYPSLSWIQGFAIACFVVMMFTAVLTCCVIAAGPKLGTVHLTAHQNLELLNYLNVVRTSKAICSDQLEELLTVHPIFPAIKISCTNCLR